MKPEEPDINTRIWQVVSLIPEGKVASYGDVARQAGLPGAARRVGAALRVLPAQTRIPWHRVVNARGHLSLPEGGASRTTQITRLQQEGVSLSNNCRLDMVKYRWRP
jgi:methylated-DNA-protein-cysteine methyltransferase-like protein